MTQGPRSVPQVTPQLLTPSQLMGAERDHRKAGLRGCSWLHSLPGLTSRRLLVHPVTLIRSQGPRPHAHLIPWLPPSIQGWTQAPGQRGETRMSAGTLVMWRACFLRGWKLPGRLPRLSDSTRSSPGRWSVCRDGRGGLRLLSELSHPEDTLPGTLSVTGDSARSLR